MANLPSPEESIRAFIDELLHNLPELINGGIDITYSFFNGVFIETRTLNSTKKEQ